MYAAQQPTSEGQPTTASREPADRRLSKRLPGGRPKIPAGEWGRIRIAQAPTARWCARARFRDFDGIIHDMRRDDSDPADARERLVEAMKSFGKETSRNSNPSADMTVAPLCDYFLKTVEADEGVGETTYIGYASNLKPALRTSVQVTDLRLSRLSESN